MFDHIVKLRSVSRFAAPDNRKVTPVIIPPNQECIEVLTGGTLFFEVDGERRTFRKGAIFWHVSRDYTIWDTPLNDPYRCQVFHFVTNPPTRMVPRVTVWHDTEMLDRFCSETFRAFHSGENDSPDLAAYCYSVLHWRASHSDSLPDELGPAPLRRAVKYLDGHFFSSITPYDVAKAAGISRPYLFKLFKEGLGISPHQYILKLRLDMAKRLLAGENFSIKEIAAECGFESLEVFYRQFKSAANTTPADYRKQYSRYR